MDVLQHLEATKAFLDQVHGLPCADVVLQAQEKHVRELLAAQRIPMADASKVLQRIRAMPWSPQVCEELTLEVGKACSRVDTSVAGKIVLQDYLEIFGYYTRSEWEKFRSDDYTSDEKLTVLTSRPLALGLKYASEGTTARLSALWLMVTDGPDRALALSPLNKHQTFLHVKKVLKNLCGGVPTATYRKLPPLAEFKDHITLEAIFDDVKPAPFPWPLSKLTALEQTIALRSSSKLLRAPSAPAHTPDVQQQLLEMMQVSSI